jgi:cytochrome c peroxidase
MKLPDNLRILLIFLVIYSTSIHSDQEQILAPGYEKLQFSLPSPDSYRLPNLGFAADGEALDTQGKTVRLYDFMGRKIILLSFIYSTCSDVNGCPLATAVFHKIKSRLQKSPELFDKLALLTISFNPQHDTPDVMKQYAQNFNGDKPEWHFLTTRSERQLQPILLNYKQSIQKIVDVKGRSTGAFSHILRVYLIDESKQIRNIYTVSFLHADTLINDVKSLLQEKLPAIKTTTESPVEVAKFAAGDNKTAYENKAYQTSSVSLLERKGQEADLLKTLHQPPLGLPPVPVPVDNKLTKNKVALGRKLFFDRRLSLNNTFSCAMCHIPEQGFSSNEMATAVGIEGRTVRRNSPTLFNVGYFQSLFHDSRERTLEQQVWGPLLAHNEMANPAIGYVIDKIQHSGDYQNLFEQVFGKPVSMETLGMAIASYERTLNSANSPFDRWYYGKDKNALNEKAQRGFKIFTGKAACSSCHRISTKFALFMDNRLHNTGIGYLKTMQNSAAVSESKQRVQLAPGIFTDIAAELVGSVSEAQMNDLGRYEVTQKPEDRWKYKTPTLRNISLTSPYMHDGSLATLPQVVQFYNSGGHANENLDPLIKPLKLNQIEMVELVSFLESLTGDNVEELISDAFAAPVGDTK